MLMRTPTRWARPKLSGRPASSSRASRSSPAKVPAGDGWLHELKHDGFRIIALRTASGCACGRRNGRDWSGDFVAITAPCAPSLPRIMLDGEAVAHCLEGLPRLSPAPQRRRPGERLPLRLRSLWLEAQDLRGVELIGRRRMLQKALKKAGPALRFSEHLEGADGEAMFRHACAMGLEGIVSKRVASRYKSGSCIAWVKVKNPDYERR